MFVSRLRLINFRSYCDSSAEFGPGLNVVVGANATGKTNLLEGAWFALRGASPRTRRDEKLILWGARFARIELTLEGRGRPPALVEFGYGPREGKRVRWGGADVNTLEELRRRSHVGIFVPESLLLLKGSPARRRAHLDAFGSAVDPRYARALRDVQEVLRQRNAQLAAVRAGQSERALDPWDAQFARVGVELALSRREVVAELGVRFSAVASQLMPTAERYAVQLVTQLEAVDFDETAFIAELRRRRPADVARGISLFGPQRDDLRFLEVPGRATDTDAPVSWGPSGATCVAVEVPAGGRDLRLYGSQGEQRLAVLALLVAEREAAADRSGEPGTLFLDDVMSELDDRRRRLLVRRLARDGQTIITTTNRQYFTDRELAGATVIDLPLEGSLAAQRGGELARTEGTASSGSDVL